MASNSNFSNSKAFSKSLNMASVKASINRVFSSRAYGTLNINNDEAEIKPIRFKPTQEQYEKIVEACKNKEYYNTVQTMIDMFELTDEQMIQLFEIDSENKMRDLEFRRSNFHRVKNIKNLPKLVEIVKKDYYDYDYENECCPYSSPEDVCTMFLNIYFSESFTFEAIQKTYEYLFEEFSPCVRFLIQEANRRQSQNSKSSFYYDEPILTEDDAIERFRITVLNTMLNIVAERDVALNDEFILENLERINTSFLMNFYRKHPENAQITKELESVFRRRCEHIIEREFGPCARLIKINIEWDLDSMVLFNEINDKESVYPFDDEF